MISFKTRAVGALAFIGLLIVLVGGLLIKLQMEQIATTERSVSFIVTTSKLSDAIHELQVERGLTVNFLGERDPIQKSNFAKELEAQKAKTEKHALVMPPEVRIDRIRDSARGVTEAFQAYTKAIDSLFASFNPQSIEEMEYIELVQQKEFAGQERVLGSLYMFSGFDQKQRERLLAVIAKQGRLNTLYPFEAIRTQAFDERMLSSPLWFEASTKRINEIAKRQQELSHSMFEKMEMQKYELRKALYLTISFVVVAIGIFGSLVVMFMRLLNKSLGGEPSYICDRLNRLSSGLLEVSSEKAAKGSILHSMNESVRSWRDIIQKIQSSTEHLNPASEKLSSSSQECMQIAAKQKVNCADMVSFIAEWTQSIDSINDAAGATESYVGLAQNASTKGTQIVLDTISQVDKVHSSIGEITGVIDKLSNSSKDISQIVSTIKDIADQTNLLALNAAIEAARAGESGRGFAVVADEVRKLAEKTAAATVTISNMVEVIQRDAVVAGEVMEDARACVSQAKNEAAGAEGAINSIQESVAYVQMMVSEILAALGTQSTLSETIANNVDQVMNLAVQNETSISNLATIEADIKRCSISCKEAVSHFKL